MRDAIVFELRPQRHALENALALSHRWITVAQQKLACSAEGAQPWLSLNALPADWQAKADRCRCSEERRMRRRSRSCPGA